MSRKNRFIPTFSWLIMVKTMVHHGSSPKNWYYDIHWFSGFRLGSSSRLLAVCWSISFSPSIFDVSSAWKKATCDGEKHGVVLKGRHRIVCKQPCLSIFVYFCGLNGISWYTTEYKYNIIWPILWDYEINLSDYPKSSKFIQNHGHVNKKNIVNHGTLGYPPCLDKLTWGFPSAMWGVPNVKPQVKTNDNAVVHVCSINSARTQYHTIYFIFNPYSVPQLFWRHVFVAFDTCLCSSFSVILTSLVAQFRHGSYT